MPDQVQLRGGSAQDNDNFTGKEREVTVDTTSNTLRVHDGTTVGGHKLLVYDQWGRAQVEDPEEGKDIANKQWVEGRVEELSISADITVSVGPSGDFESINSAISYLSNKKPSYQPTGFVAEIRLLSGFEMSEQVLLRRIDLGWIVINSEDPTVGIVRSSLTESFASGTPAFGANENATLPTLNVLFEMDSTGSPDNCNGISLVDNSSVVVNSGAGIVSTGEHGIFVSRGSRAVLAGANFSSPGTDGIYCDRASTAEAFGVDVSNAGRFGLYSLRGSTISASQADCSGAGSRAAAAEGSMLSVRDANCSNSGGEGIYILRNSFAEARNVDASNASGRGFWARYGSVMNAEIGDASGAGINGFHVSNGGIINANDSTGSLSQSANSVTANGIIFK